MLLRSTNPFGIAPIAYRVAETKNSEQEWKQKAGDISKDNHTGGWNQRKSHHAGTNWKGQAILDSIGEIDDSLRSSAEAAMKDLSFNFESVSSKFLLTSLDETCPESSNISNIRFILNLRKDAPGRYSWAAGAITSCDIIRLQPVFHPYSQSTNVQPARWSSSPQ